jgi:hypothetical protein
MKTIVLSILCAFLFAPVNFLRAQESEQHNSFPGVRKAMPREEYEAAGLRKLSPEERARLDAFIRGRASSAHQRAAEEASAAALDRAVQEGIGQAPRVIESRIVGPLTGYDGHSTFKLENGQRWTQSQRVSLNFPRVDSPRVTIVKGLIGYQMFIVGGGVIRVQQVKIWPDGRRSYY